MTEPLTLMVVHAHPDDEAIGTGGTFAYYKERGVRTVLVMCTLGEEGEIVDSELDTPENHVRLAEIRYGELSAAAKQLGIDHIEFLPYRDSGMAGTPSNQHPESFAQADLDEATGRLVELVRRYRPQVLVSYNEHGGYGHPDHVNAHKITVRAFDTAGDPQQFADAADPWTPAKLYYISFRRALWLKIWQAMRERGLSTMLDDPNFDPNRFVDDPRITTTIDIKPYLKQKLTAMRAHRTQIRPDWMWLGVPEDICSELLCSEYFIRVAARVPVPEEDQTDLFAGLWHQDDKH
jgi:N-acetyl-1-D-myo-inositol-2-amino-2-deoxy-alpha-D-glucopyranoside deacetylase